MIIICEVFAFITIFTIQIDTVEDLCDLTPYFLIFLTILEINKYAMNELHAQNQESKEEYMVVRFLYSRPDHIRRNNIINA